MERIYKKLKGKKVKYPDCEGIVCGYTENRLVMAVEGSPNASFRRFDKGGGFVEEEYKDARFRYLYTNEVDVYKSNPRLNYGVTK